ncbi:unnamed protein product, partial [Urochloa humidicola]
PVLSFLCASPFPSPSDVSHDGAWGDPQAERQAARGIGAERRTPAGLRPGAMVHVPRL